MNNISFGGHRVRGFALGAAIRAPSGGSIPALPLLVGAGAGIGAAVLARHYYDTPPLAAVAGGALIGVGTAIGMVLLTRPTIRSSIRPTSTSRLPPYRPLTPRGSQTMSTPGGAALIRQSVLDNWIPFNTAQMKWTGADGNAKSSPNEGLKIPSYMYEDILGLVTTGLGNLIENPVTKPTQGNPSTEGSITNEGLNAGWEHTDGTPATPDEVRAEFSNVKSQWSAGHWEPLGGFNDKGRAIATLFLPEAAVNKLIFSKLQAFADSLKTQLPGFDSFPADAQMALLSHAWAAGSALDGWPKFKGFINQSLPDWRSAAAEGYIYGPNHSIIAGITPRNDSNMRLMINAEGVEHGNGDPSTLYFPQSVPGSVA